MRCDMKEEKKKAYPFQEEQDEINALMREYSLLKLEPGNKAKCRRLKAQVASKIYTSEFRKALIGRTKILYKGYGTIEDCEDAVSDAVVNSFNKYDAEFNNNYCAYLFLNLRWTVSTDLRRRCPWLIVDDIIEDEEDNVTSMIDTTPDMGEIIETGIEVGMRPGETIDEDESDIRHRFEYYLSNLIPCVIKSKEHRGKRNEYYRSFASDFYISSCKEGLHRKYRMNENAALDVMDFTIADYTLSDECRSFVEFETIPCKTYHEIEIFEGDYSEGRIETPFRNCVYAKLFGVTDGAVSQQRGYFQTEIGAMVREEL